MGNGTESLINIAEIVERSGIHGPGERFVIWVQGCALGCDGCWNERMQPFIEVDLWEVGRLFKRIISTEGIQGVTILGGEPLHQSGPLSKLASQIREAGLDIMLYTGFERDEVTDPSSIGLLDIADIVVYGRYQKELRSTRLRWRGSSNQTVVFNSKEMESMFSSRMEMTEIEVLLDEKGEITLMGFPDEDFARVVLN